LGDVGLFAGALVWSRRHTMTAGTKRGFTIVELLVVITIIAILMAMVFPAIGAIRVAARKAQCVNRQSQIGKAMLGYAANKGGQMPPVQCWRPGAAQDRIQKWEDYWNWVHVILPDIGRPDFYEIVAANPAIRDGRDRRTLGTYIEVLVCPADPPATITGAQTEAPLSYVANGGRENDRESGLPLDWPDNGALSEKLVVPSNNPFMITTQGKIARGDGQGTTIMLSENVDVEHWSDIWKGYQFSLIWQKRDNPQPGLNQDIGGGLDVYHARPSSRHPGGFVVTFCDGHTRFMSDQIRYQTYALLMTCNGRGTREPGSRPTDRNYDPPPVPDWQATPVREADLQR